MHIMAGKRKDNKGRVLRTGESQRKDKSYQYRYKDKRGKYCYIYAPTLDELRAKEQDIRRDINAGLDYMAGKTTVMELARQYTAQQTGRRKNTVKGYNFVLNLLQNEDISNRQIKSITLSAAKQFFTGLSQKGYSFSTLIIIQGVLRPAFKIAVEDDVLRKNPFDFSLRGVVPNDTQERKALTSEEQERLLDFMQTDETASKYYDEIFILLNTGLRISELCGLTKRDVDFEKNRICVDKQLVRSVDGEYYIERTKTKCGYRFVPMTEDVIQAFRRVLEKRHTNTERIIQGYGEFVFLDKNGNPKVAGHLEKAMKRFISRYNAEHPAQPLKVTPHVLRHTFCNNLAHTDMPIKDLQYIMGHEDIKTTLNIYAHADYDATANAFYRAVAR